MPRIERTPEERKLFYEERLNVLTTLTEVQDYDKRENPDENKKAMMALVDTLDSCENLVSICGNLAGLAVRRGTVKMGPGEDDAKRPITLRDIRILQSALWSRRKEMEPKTEKPEETPPEVIRIRKAISRLNPVQLFYAAIHGGPYRYKTTGGDRNQISVAVQRERYFGGIPEDKLPTRTVEIKRDNVTDTIARTDVGIYPDNAKKIYDILVALEKEQPTVDIGAKPGDRKVIGRRVHRTDGVGEAKFFLDHLPKGLKPWTETTN